MNESICEVCGKRFTSMTGLNLHRKLAKECSRTGPKDKSHAQRRAKEYAEQFIADGERPHVAHARARAAYGLQDRAPAGNPQPTAEMRRAWLDEAATARRSERLPSVEGRTSGSVGGTAMTPTPLSDSVLRTCSDLSLLTRGELERLVRLLREEIDSPKAKRKARAKGAQR